VPSFRVAVQGCVKPSKNRLSVIDAGATSGNRMVSFSPLSRTKFHTAVASGAMVMPDPEGGGQLPGTEIVAVGTAGGPAKLTVTLFR